MTTKQLAKEIEAITYDLGIENLILKIKKIEAINTDYVELSIKDSGYPVVSFWYADYFRAVEIVVHHSEYVCSVDKQAFKAFNNGIKVVSLLSRKHKIRIEY